MASSASITLQYRFKESWQPVWQLADDERQHSQPPLSTPVLPYIDESLQIMARTQMAQDKGIKAEFKQQRCHVDARFDDVDARFDAVDVRFDEVKDELRDMKQDISDLKVDVSDLKVDVAQQRKDFERRFDAIEARMINSRACRPGARISPIGKSVDGEFYPAPYRFPQTVRHFWRLRLPEERTTFVRLVHFYEIDLAIWPTLDDHQDETNLDSDKESEESFLKTADAVNRNPNSALEALADEIGLDYGRILATMSKADLYQDQVSTLSKRKEYPTVDAPSVKQPKYPPQPPPVMRVPLEELLALGNPPIPKSESPIAYTQIGWGSYHSDETRAMPQVVAPYQRSNPEETTHPEGKVVGDRMTPSKRSERSTREDPKKSLGSRKTSSKRSEGSTIPITSEERREWENRSDR